ncbi:hypothetical protein JXQ70_15600 [bacterium]|nr:hypothetical protein [bacterium]
MAHLSMIDYISESGHFMQGGWGPIYPQALHGLFALVSDICGLASRQMITLLLMAFMILLPVILYYFSKFFVPTLSIGPFFLVLVISNAEFIQYSLFELYSFPAVFAVELFVLSLFYLINEHYLSSSLLFTAALLSYPYYAFVFGLISFLFLIRNLLKSMVKPYLMIIWSWLYFVLPGLYLFLYLVTFLKTGYAQQEQGFDPAIKLVPFDFLTNTNALLIIVGLYCSVRYKLSKAIHFLALTVMLGFLGYYLPYLFFSVQTAYYFMKNVHYLILFGIVFELIAVMMFIDKIDCRRNIRIIVDILILLCSLCYYWFVQ